VNGASETVSSTIAFMYDSSRSDVTEWCGYKSHRKHSS